MNKFTEYKPSLESYYRGIILFGKNSAAYKFALSKAIMDMSINGKDFITLEELAEPYSRHLIEHIKKSEKQTTSKSSEFLETCKSFINSKIQKDELMNITVKLGFNNVLDAFHNLNGGTIPIKFFELDNRLGKKGIILTDNLYKVMEESKIIDFYNETEARWNLVEKAWELNISNKLIDIKYDGKVEQFFINNDYNRVNITSCRDALNGYQKGKCFYCFDDISTNSLSGKLADVDHFIPHVLQIALKKDLNLDGIWNLVLACKKCNRGSGGKFERILKIQYLERLNNRNEFLIKSHHPLRETIIRQTGSSEDNRSLFLQKMYNQAIEYLPSSWEIPLSGEEIF